jgi:hypothetical protein
MPFLRRNELSWNTRFRRCLYFFLRDELDSLLITESLIESYKVFTAKKKDYPFVEMRELKPRAKIHAPEYPEQRAFIVILAEDQLPLECRTHIRFFESNKITKENLGLLGLFDLQDVFHQRMRYFEHSEFVTLLKSILTTDYALLIQRDTSVKARYRFGLSHFHVKIDWPVAYAAEDLGRHLKYISKNLYEKGERLGEILQQKLYEYYGFHHTVGGRRTAGLVAAQYLARFDFISTVYVSSAESRTLIRTSEQGVSKYALIKISNQEIKEISGLAKLQQSEFVDTYLIDKTADYGVGIFLVTYERNEHSHAPLDGKPRDLNPDYQWLNVDLQLLVPPPTKGDARPIPLSRVYG